MNIRRWLPRWHGIQARFLPILAVFVVVSMAALGTTLFFNQRRITLNNFTMNSKEARQVLHDKGVAYSNFLARIAPQGILSHDYFLLEGYAEELSSDPDIVYAVILNRAHLPITHFLKKTGAPSAVTGVTRVEPEQFVESLLKARADASLLIVKRDIRYNGALLGNVEVGLSQAKIAHKLDELKANLKRDLRRIAVLTGAEILIALVLLIVLSEWAFRRVAVKPIQALGADMERVQSGDLGVRANVEHDDEIGWLARHFNKMTADLGDRLLQIEEQRRAYKETRDYLANILDNSADMIVTTGVDGAIVEFNAAAERILGRRHAAVVGTSWDRVYPHEAERERLQAIVRRGEPAPGVETTLIRGDGTAIDAELTISALRDNDGRVIGAVYIGRDITHAKAMRRELIQAEKMASVGQVASWIAHQIRNVLGRLLMHVSALRPPENSEPARMKTHRDFTAGIREMDSLVTNLLEYSRTLTLHLGPMKLNASLDGLAATLAPPDSEIPLRIERRFDADLPVIQADVFKVEQAIGNILKNAVEAIPGGGMLRITTRRERETGAVAIGIEDTGPGIPAKDLPHVFRPFFTTKLRGTGLGLAMAERIIQAHGGAIRAANTPRGGACFTIILPEIPGRPETHE
ncbi:MAG: sensor histidine kinase [Sulfuricaulis sp.]